MKDHYQAWPLSFPVPVDDELLPSANEWTLHLPLARSINSSTFDDVARRELEKREKENIRDRELNFVIGNVLMYFS